MSNCQCTVNSGNFREGLFSRNFAYAEFRRIKPSRISDISFSFTDVGKLCQSREFLVGQICLLTLFAKIKFSRKFPNL